MAEELSAIESLEREIARLQERLEVRQRLLRELKRSEGIPLEEDRISPESVEYVNYPTAILAILAWFEKRGDEPALPSEIIDALVKGGAAINKKRGRANIRISIESQVKEGVLAFEGSTISGEEEIEEAVAADRYRVYPVRTAESPPGESRKQFFEGM